MTIKEAARNVAETLKKYGWVRQVNGSTSMGFCAIGAIAHARDNDRSVHDVYYQLRRKLDRAELEAGHCCLVCWNDKIAADKETVIARFEAIANG